MSAWFTGIAKNWMAMTAPPQLSATTVPEREHSRKARLLSAILLASAILALPLIALNLVNGATGNVLAVVLFEITLVIPAMFNRRGQLAYASYSYFFSYIIIASWAYSLDIPQGTAPLLWEWVLLTLPPFFSGLFLPYWQPACFAVLDSIIIAGILLTIGQHDAVLQRLPGFTVPTFLGYVVTLMIAIGVISGLFAHSVAQAVTEADRATELEQANAVIEMAHFELADAYARLEELAAHDPITGLLNHRTLDIRLAREIDQAECDGQSLGVIFADLDHFKQVNDTWGHQVGDLMLAYLAKRLREHTRGADIVARYGGEEFVIVLPNMDYTGAYQLAERLRATVALMPLTLAEGSIVPLTLSLGVALYPADGDTLEAIITAADNAMYRAKHTGRNRVCCATDNETAQAA